MSERKISLDGLRGMAVIFVFFYHHNLLNMGWAGVDLFFVISGYLITTILRRSRGDVHYWKEFWIKRATRIVPPLLPLLLVAALMSHEMAKYIPAFLLSFGVVLAYLHPHSEQTRPLWSLAVQEHFYLLWPFAVRFLNRRWLVACLLSILIAEPFVRAIAVSRVHSWEFVYFLTPFRVDGISLGSALALAMESERSRSLLARFSGAGMLAAGLLYAVLWWAGGAAYSRGENPFYNATAYLLVALVSFFLIAYLICWPVSIAARLLSLKPLVFRD